MKTFPRLNISFVNRSAAVSRSKRIRTPRAVFAVWSTKLCCVLCAFVIVSCLCVPQTALAASSKTEAFQPSRVIVSMGDSYSSGEGNEPFYGQKDKSGLDKSLEERLASADWLAHRSTKSWPGQLTLLGLDGQMKDYKDTYWYFVATSGAETMHFYVEFEKDYDRIIIPDLENLKNALRSMLDWDLDIKFESVDLTSIISEKYGTNSIEPQLNIFDDLKKKNIHVDYVTLTLGGNDLGFSDVVSQVFMNSINGTNDSDETLEDMLNTAKSRIIPNEGGSKPALYINLYDAYKDIAANVDKDTAIIVAGYPPLFKETGSHFSDLSFFIEASLLNPIAAGLSAGISALYNFYNIVTDVVVSADEARAVNKAVKAFNEQIQKIVTDLRVEEGLNIHYVDVYEKFAGHEAGSKDPYLKPVNILKLSQDLEGTVTQKIFNNGFLDGLNLGSAYSIHPNEKGIAIYAECVQKKIDELEALKRYNYALNRLTESGSWYEACFDWTDYELHGETAIMQVEIYDGQIRNGSASAAGYRYNDAVNEDWNEFRYNSASSESGRPYFFMDMLENIGDASKGLFENIVELEEDFFTVRLTSDQYYRMRLDSVSALRKWEENNQTREQPDYSIEDLKNDPNLILELYGLSDYSVEDLLNNPLILLNYYSTGKHLEAADNLMALLDEYLYGNQVSNFSNNTLISLGTEDVLMTVEFNRDMTLCDILFETVGKVQGRDGKTYAQERDLVYVFSDEPMDAVSLFDFEDIIHADTDDDAYDDIDDSLDWLYWLLL